MVLAGRTACGERSELVGTGKGIGSVHSRDESLPGRNQTPPETLEHFVDTPAKLKTHRALVRHTLIQMQMLPLPENSTFQDGKHGRGGFGAELCQRFPDVTAGPPVA